MFTGSLKCVLMSFVTISRIIDVDYEWKSADSSRNGVLDSPKSCRSETISVCGFSYCVSQCSNSNSSLISIFLGSRHSWSTAALYRALSFVYRYCFNDCSWCGRNWRFLCESFEFRTSYLFKMTNQDDQSWWKIDATTLCCETMKCFHHFNRARNYSLTANGSLMSQFCGGCCIISTFIQ